MKKISQKITIYILVCLFLLNYHSAYAVNIENNQHRLEIFPSTVNPSDFKSTISQIYLSDKKEPLSLNISSDAIDFGPVSPTTEVIRRLHIGSNFPNKISLYIAENHQLIFEQEQIPDTSCDDGSCTEVLASTWANPLTFGFGYTFDLVNYYKFPNLNNHKEPIPVKQNDILLKLNLNQAQKKGVYSNMLTILQIPKY